MHGGFGIVFRGTTVEQSVTHERDSGERESVILPSFPGFDPNREDNRDSETRDEGTEHKDITVVRVGSKAEELWSGYQKLVNRDHNLLTRFIMRLAEMFTGTPSSVSTIIKPDPTSFTHRASRAYLRGHNH